MQFNKKQQMRLENAPVPKAHGHHQHTGPSMQAASAFATVQAVVGISCLLFTERIHKAFPIILGILMVVVGIGDMIRGFMTGEYRNADTKLTAWGIVNLVLGIVILVHYRNADQIIGAIWGVIGLIKGSEALNLSIHQWATGKSFMKMLIQGAVELVLGILLLLDPLSAVEHHLFLLGIELIIRGIQSVIEVRKTEENDA